MFYTDAEYGFSIEFPDEWTNTPGHVSSFERKRIIFSPVRPPNSEDKVKGGELNIAVATRGFIPDPHKRERQMVSFVKTKNFFSFNWGQRVYTLAKKLDSEPNTAWVETKNLLRRVEITRGVIEAIRYDTAYTIQYGYTQSDQAHITSMIESFRFGRKQIIQDIVVMFCFRKSLFGEQEFTTIMTLLMNQPRNSRGASTLHVCSGFLGLSPPGSPPAIKVLAQWIIDGRWGADATGLDRAFREKLRPDLLRDDLEAGKQLGYMPYVFAVGPISPEYAEEMRSRLAGEFPEFLGIIAFQETHAIAQLAEGLRLKVQLELQL